MLLTLDEGEPTPEFIRVDYDIERTMRGIRESELPNVFAEALCSGGMPGSPLEYKTVSDDYGETPP